MLEVKNLAVKYGENVIVDDLSFSVNEGQWLMIVGPNGAGKSTALGAISQGVNYSGEVLFDGKNVGKMNPAERAHCMGVLMQYNFVGYSFSVEEIIRLGRYAYTPGIFSKKAGGEEKAVEEALEFTGMTEKRAQSVLTLSGGELQRTFLAQVFAQNPKLLILDEPTNHLDLIYQKQIFALISEWLKTPGRAVVSVVHDLSLAKAFGTDALLMNKGKAVAMGAAKEILNSENLDAVYGMDVADWMKKMLGQWEK